MKNTEENKGVLWDFLLDVEIATEKELQLVTAINGYNVETLEAVLYARTGYRDFDQYAECELIGH